VFWRYAIILRPSSKYVLKSMKTRSNNNVETAKTMSNNNNVYIYISIYTCLNETGVLRFSGDGRAVVFDVRLYETSAAGRE